MLNSCVPIIMAVADTSAFGNDCADRSAIDTAGPFVHAVMRAAFIHDEQPDSFPAADVILQSPPTSKWTITTD